MPSCRLIELPAPFVSVTFGVGQPDKIESLADMGAAEARSAQIARPNGVTRSFHVSRYKIEPSKSVLARNLLAKHDCRSALADEVVPVRP